MSLRADDAPGRHIYLWITLARRGNGGVTGGGVGRPAEPALCDPLPRPGSRVTRRSLTPALMVPWPP